MSQEKMRILKMIEEGKLTAGEGLELLESLQEDDTFAPLQPEERPAPGGKRKLCIKITDISTGKAKVNISLPLGLVKRLPALIPAGARKAAGGIDLDELFEGLASTGAPEKLIDVVDEEDGEHIEIYFT